MGHVNWFLIAAATRDSLKVEVAGYSCFGPSAFVANTHSTLGLKVRLAPSGIIMPIVILECEK